MENLINKARELAILSHKNTYDGQDYVVHLDEVYHITKEFNLDDNFGILAYTHDLLEDTNVSKDELEKMFGKWVSDKSFKMSGFGANRKERKEDILKKLKNDIDAINGKMCDRLANMRNAKKNNKNKLLKMYIDELYDYESLFKEGDLRIYNELMSFKNEKIIEKSLSLKI